MRLYADKYRQKGFRTPINGLKGLNSPAYVPTPPTPPQFVDGTEVWIAAGTASATVVTPTHSPGDLLIYSACTQSNTDTISPPGGSGFALLSGPDDQSGGGTIRSYLWWKVAEESEPANRSFSHAGGTGACHFLTSSVTLGYGSIDDWDKRAATTNSTTLTIPSVTPTAANTLILVHVLHRGAATQLSDIPDNYTADIRTNSINPPQAALLWKSYTGTTPTGTDTTGGFGASVAANSYILAIK